MSEPENPGAAMAQIDEARTRLCELLRSKGVALVAERPPSGEWSPVENVRHLLFAEQLHLGRFLPDGFKWSGLGLTPHFLANEDAFSDVNTQPDDDLEAVLGAWDAVHVPIRELVDDEREGLQEGLEGNLKHLRFHIGIIESLLGEPGERAKGADGMTRRIVTGNNAEGKSSVVTDGPAFEFGTLTELWATDIAPASYGSDDEVAGRQVKLEPPANGTIFRFFRVEQQDPNLTRDEIEAGTAAGFAAVGAEHCRPDTSRDPGMHTTRTVDYVVMLKGEVTLLLDEGEVDLKPFDVVIQRGTNHAWINKGTEPAELVGILVDAEPR